MKIIGETRRDHGLHKSFDVPMQYLTLAVEYCLRHFGTDGLRMTDISGAQWKEALYNSGYVEAEVDLEII